MTMQTITTRYYGPTNFKGARIRVRSSSGITRWFPYPHEKHHDEKHKYCAMEFAKTLGWKGNWSGGEAPDGRGLVFVNTDRNTDSFTVESNDD